MSPSPELAAALDAAAAAARVIRELYAAKLAVRVKSDASPVTEADVRAEEAIRDVLGARFPGHAFYGEETGRRGSGDALWLVDPIDGTKAFVREYPMFSTQIALMRAGRLVLGVSSAPLYGELAWAERGAGAWLNGRPLQVSAVATLEAPDFFGEMGLLTGERRKATVAALTEAEAWRVEKDDFHEILEKRPALAEAIARRVSEREAELAAVREGLSDEARKMRVARSQSLTLAKIREFFGIG